MKNRNSLSSFVAELRARFGLADRRWEKSLLWVLSLAILLSSGVGSAWSRSGAKAAELNDELSKGIEFLHRSQLEKALSKFLNVWQRAETSGEEKLAARALKNLGSLAIEENLPRQAFYFYQQAGIGFSELGDKKELCNCRSNLGNALLMMACEQEIESDREALFTRALALYEEALSEGKSLSFPFWKIGATLNNVAALWLKRADFALRSDGKNGSEAGRKAIVHNCLDKAMKASQSAFKILGKSADSSGKGRAARNGDDISFKRVRADCLLNLGTVYLRQEKFSKAIGAFDEVQSLAEENGFPTVLVKALVNKAVALKSSDKKKSLSQSLQAIERLEVLQGALRSPRGAATFFESLVFIYEQAIGLALQLGKMELAFSLVEGAKGRVFQSIVGERRFRLKGRQLALKGKGKGRQLALKGKGKGRQLALKGKGKGRQLTLMGKGKSRQLALMGKGKSRQLALPIAQEEWQLSREIDNLYERLLRRESETEGTSRGKSEVASDGASSVGASGAGSTEASAAVAGSTEASAAVAGSAGAQSAMVTLLEELSKKEARRQVLQGKLREVAPDYLALRQPQRVVAASVQKLLGDDEVILDYWLGRNWAFVFVLTKDFVVGSRLSCHPRFIERLVDDFTEHCIRREISGEHADGNLWQESLYQLYVALIAGVEPLLTGKSRWVVSPHSVLHKLPFAALILKKDAAKRPDYAFPKPSYLIEKVTLSYTPSAFALTLARQGKSQRKKSGLVFANAIYPDHLAPLEAAVQESEAVKKALGRVLVFEGEEATERRFKDLCADFGYIHLATHGELWSQDPLSSPIYLTASAGEDGRLTVAEIFDLDFDGAFVMLSGCQTGLLSSFSPGRRTLGDDLIGLTRAFLYGGGRTIGASLWSVDDEPTAKLMGHFYRSLLSVGPARALQKAQCEFLGDEGYLAHPYYWASFLVLGDGR